MAGATLIRNPVTWPAQWGWAVGSEDFGHQAHYPGLDVGVRARSGRVCHASRAVLATHSPWLAQLMTEGSDLVLWDIAEDVLISLLALLHLGQASLPPTRVDELRYWLSALGVPIPDDVWLTVIPDPTEPVVVSVPSVVHCPVCWARLEEPTEARRHLEHHRSMIQQSFVDLASRVLAGDQIPLTQTCAGCRGTIHLQPDHPQRSLQQHFQKCIETVQSELQRIQARPESTLFQCPTCEKPFKIIFACRKHIEKCQPMRPLRISAVTSVASISPMMKAELQGTSSSERMPDQETLFELCENARECIVPGCPRAMSIFHWVKHPETQDLLRKVIPQHEPSYQCTDCHTFPPTVNRTEFLDHLVSHWELNTPNFLKKFTLSDLLRTARVTTQSLASPEKRISNATAQEPPLNPPRTISAQPGQGSPNAQLKRSKIPEDPPKSQSQCPACRNGIQYRDTQRLKIHVLTVHLKEHFKAAAPSSFPATCSFPKCRKTHSNFRAYVVHMGLKHGKMQEILDRPTPTGNLFQHVRALLGTQRRRRRPYFLDSSKGITCQKCPTYLPNLSETLRHYFAHYSFKFNKCQYKAPEKSAKDQLYHCVEPLFDGSKCDSKFVIHDKHTMKLHLACVHEWIRKYLEEDGIDPTKSGSWSEEIVTRKRMPGQRAKTLQGRIEVLPEEADASDDLVCSKCGEIFPNGQVQELHACLSKMDEGQDRNDRGHRDLLKSAPSVSDMDPSAPRKEALKKPDPVSLSTLIDYDLNLSSTSSEDSSQSIFDKPLSNNESTPAATKHLDEVCLTLTSREKEPAPPFFQACECGRQFHDILSYGKHVLECDKVDGIESQPW